MPESAEEIYARVVATVGDHGRLPMPPVNEWDEFPWEVVDGELRPKVLRPPYAAEPGEPPRWGETPEKPCGPCAADRSLWIWENDRWFVSRGARPSGLPLVLWLHPKRHLDLAELNDTLAAEAGRLQVWLARIIGHLPHVGRVHVCRYGDGSAHLHWWFVARPARLPGISGSLVAEWDDMLPPVPERIWEADWCRVATKLANHDGRALVPARRPDR